jgi:cold shock CspA family protein
VTGLVVFWHTRRYFGRIVGDDDLVYWVEKTRLLGRHALKRGDSVKFTPFAHEKGPRALAVHVVEPPARRGSRAVAVQVLEPAAAESRR